MESEGKRVLLIEDDGTLRTLYRDELESAHFVVEEAIEGNEGLRKSSEGGYDVILMDILLPGLKGPQILERLQTNPPKRPNGMILMLTNQSDPDVLEKCRFYGAKGAIIKSKATPKQIVEKMRDYLLTGDPTEVRSI